MNYIGTSINNSATIYGISAAEIKDGAGKFVDFDVTGNIDMIKRVGAKAVGLLLMQTPETVKAGDEVTIQVKDIGAAIAGGALKRGDEVTSDAQGRATKAVATNYVIGYAMNDAANAGDIVQVQITKSGYKA